MRNDFEKLAAEWGVPVAIALVAVGARMLFSASRMTLLGVARGIVVGLLVGCLVNMYLSDMPNMTDGEKGAIVGVSAVLAEDLFVALLAFGRKIRNDPSQLIDTILRIRR